MSDLRIEFENVHYQVLFKNMRGLGIINGLNIMGMIAGSAVGEVYKEHIIRNFVRESGYSRKEAELHFDVNMELAKKFICNLNDAIDASEIKNKISNVQVFNDRNFFQEEGN